MSAAGCSLDVMPVHYSWVNSARNANKPIERGPNAPGAFKKTWNFTQVGGYLFDPSKIEIAEGVARLKESNEPKGPKYSTAREKAVMEASRNASYVALDSFVEKTGPKHQGEIRYQLSNDGSKWFYHDGKAWVSAFPVTHNSNTAQDVNSKITTFHTEAGAGNLHIRMFLISPKGAEPVELQEIEVGGIAPRTDGWD